MLAELKNPTKLAAGEQYDSLLITERHNPLDTTQWENGVGYLRHYHDRLASALPSARTFFYQCWPDIDKADPSPWIAYQKTELFAWECIAAKVNLSLAAEQKAKAVHVIPGSVALAKLVEKALAGGVPGLSGSQGAVLDQIFADDVHLATAGQYLIAAALYGSLYGKSPVGAHAGEGLSADTADAIERIAWEVVSAYATDTSAATRTMEECRSRIASEVCPAYYAIRDLSVPGQGCGYWTSAQSPFTFPDPALPLPAP